MFCCKRLPQSRLLQASWSKFVVLHLNPSHRQFCTSQTSRKIRYPCTVSPASFVSCMSWLIVQTERSGGGISVYVSSRGGSSIIISIMCATDGRRNFQLSPEYFRDLPCSFLTYRPASRTALVNAAKAASHHRGRGRGKESAVRRQDDQRRSDQADILCSFRPSVHLAKWSFGPI